MATRTLQKQRTRQLIVDATAALLAGGRGDPSMEEIAARAEVSRATVYRYFDTPSDVVWQVMADRSIPSPDEVLSGDHGTLEAAVDAIERVVNDFLFADPDGARAFERVVLARRLAGHADDADRPRRRLRYIDAALDRHGEQLSPPQRDRLRHALALVVGTETVIALLDVCGLDPDAARDVTRFAARALVRAALEEAPE